MPKFEHTINYGELKQLYIKAVEGKRICKRNSNESKLRDLVRGWQTRSRFYGPSSKQMIEWLHKGYVEKGLTLDPPIDPVRKRRRLQYGDEGELQLDLMWSGHDYPFLQWTKREIMPGMRVDILYNFQAGTQVNVIIDYCRFVLRSLVALESAGIDLEVWISSDSSNIFSGSWTDTLYNHVQVKKEGEQTDYLGWSAMISPGGFRHLMFLDYVVSSDSLGKDVSGGLGRAVNMPGSWKVSFDPQERFLRFYCPWHPYDFPEKEMETQLREVIKMSRSVA